MIEYFLRFIGVSNNPQFQNYTVSYSTIYNYMAQASAILFILLAVVIIDNIFKMFRK